MSISMQAIQTTLESKKTFCKFLSANDTGQTGGHQAGVYISKPSIGILFETPGIKGENKEKWVRIQWQNGLSTDSRFIYYGQGTRNEYRITNFGKEFPYLRPEYTGALFVLSQIGTDYYKGFVLNTEDEINSYLDAFGLTPAETNRLIETENVDASVVEKIAIDRFIATLTEDFPGSDVMASAARRIVYACHNNNMAIQNPDKALLTWTAEEYRLFKALEIERYGPIVKDGFDTVDDFVRMAHQVLNRRKSSAGKSLEHHLASIFDENDISYSAQAVTEGNKRPDFVFPSIADYHDFSFPVSRLTTLAAKTTCKDRWRQILNEADRLRGERKYLCTLQQGISATQMDEMEAEKVTLVVPKPYISAYPHEKQERIWTISRFVSYIKDLEQGEAEKCKAQ